MLVKANSKPRTKHPALQPEETPGSYDAALQKSLPVWLLLAIVCALSLLVGLPSLQGKFLADDFTWLNLLCTRPQEIFLSGLHGRYMYYPIFGEHYRPLLSIPFLADALLFGPNACLLHFSNLLWHTACAVLVFFVSKNLWQSFSLPDPDGSLSGLKQSGGTARNDASGSDGESNGARIFRPPFENELLPRIPAKQRAMQATQIAFWAAAIFAVHPFHCENIGWWTAKNDIVYSFFYLLSLNLFLSRDSKHRAYTYCAFVLALCCKETALTLPFLLCAHSFLKNMLERQNEPPKPFFQESLEKLKSSLSETKFFFASLAGFWLLRTVCLGQIGGSYYGSLTNLWIENFGERFGNLTKNSILWYPVDFNDGVFSRTMLYLFAVVYVAFIVGIIYSWHFRTQSERNRTSASMQKSLCEEKTQAVSASETAQPFSSLVLFLAAFTVLTLLPACLIWSPSTTLEGTRLLYLFTVPLSLACSILIIGPLLQHVPNAFRTALLVSLLTLLSVSCLQTHLRWSFASNFCTELTQRIESESQRLLPDEKLLLLDIPRTIRGVSIFHHHSILQDSLRPPFFEGSNASKIAAFEPHYFGEHDRINLERVQSIVDGREKAHLLYVMPNFDVLTANILDLSSSSKLSLGRIMPAKLFGNAIPIRKTLKAGEGNKRTSGGLYQCNFPIQLDNLINGADYGIVRLHLTNAGATKLKFKICWKSAQAKFFDREHSKFFYEPYEAAYMTGDEQQASEALQKTITVNLGTTITWLKEHDIDAILVSLMADGAKLESVELLSNKGVLPILSARQDRESSNPIGNDGTLRSINGSFNLSYDASSIAGCRSVLVEVAPALIDFMDISGKQLDLKECTKPARKFVVPGTKSSFQLDDNLGSPVWHQIRILPLDQRSNPIGYASEPLYLQSVLERSPSETALARASKDEVTNRKDMGGPTR